MVDMTWQEVEKAAEEGAVILTTTAVVEQHGPHMNCGIDTYLGYLYCTHVQRELEARGVKALVAPPFFWGINSASHVFAGSFTVRPETMKALLHDIFASLKSMGFTDIVNINAHGDGADIRTAIRRSSNPVKVWASMCVMPCPLGKRSRPGFRVRKHLYSPIRHQSLTWPP